jgi:hypothetical protein
MSSKSNRASPPKSPRASSPKSNRIDSLPENVLVDIALEMPLLDILHLCVQNKRMNKMVCENDYFWKLRFEKDFTFKKPNDYQGTYKQLYMINVMPISIENIKEMVLKKKYSELDLLAGLPNEKLFKIFNPPKNIFSATLGGKMIEDGYFNLLNLLFRRSDSDDRVTLFIDSYTWLTIFHFKKLIDQLPNAHNIVTSIPTKTYGMFLYNVWLPENKEYIASFRN